MAAICLLSSNFVVKAHLKRKRRGVKWREEGRYINPAGYRHPHQIKIERTDLVFYAAKQGKGRRRDRGFLLRSPLRERDKLLSCQTLS